jgi:hypothetical protein
MAGPYPGLIVCHAAAWAPAITLYGIAFVIANELRESPHETGAKTRAFC